MNIPKLQDRKVLIASLKITFTSHMINYICHCGCDSFTKLESIFPDWFLYRCNCCDLYIGGEIIDGLPKDLT